MCPTVRTYTHTKILLYSHDAQRDEVTCLRLLGRSVVKLELEPTPAWLQRPCLMFAVPSTVSRGCPEEVPWPLTQEDQRAFQLGGAETRVSGCGWPRVGGQWIWIKEEDVVCPPAWEQGGCCGCCVGTWKPGCMEEEGRHLPCRAPLTPSLGLAARSSYS